MPSGQIPPSEDGVTEVKVTSYPGQSTGWAAMSKDVREFDEEKVQSCKDDVDTLLVFVSTSPLRTTFVLLTSCVSRLVCSLQSSPLSWSLPIPTSNPPPLP